MPVGAHLLKLNHNQSIEDWEQNINYNGESVTAAQKALDNITTSHIEQSGPVR